MGLTARVKASFVLRRQSSIDLPGPKCSKVEKEEPMYLSGNQIARGRDVMAVVRVGVKGFSAAGFTMMA